jgi:transcriptional regulator with XRE-family HTH domain
MARAALRWDIPELASRANLHRMTISRFELEQSKGTRATKALLRLALEAAGVEFLPEGGVRLREQPAEVTAA